MSPHLVSPGVIFKTLSSKQTETKKDKPRQAEARGSSDRMRVTLGLLLQDRLISLFLGLPPLLVLSAHMKTLSAAWIAEDCLQLPYVFFPKQKNLLPFPPRWSFTF